MAADSTINSLENVANNEQNDSSLEQMCCICLEKVENAVYTDICIHKFCFVCLLKWSKVKNVCPLCQQIFRNIIHNGNCIKLNWDVLNNGNVSSDSSTVSISSRSSESFSSSVHQVSSTNWSQESYSISEDSDFESRFSISSNGSDSTFINYDLGLSDDSFDTSYSDVSTTSDISEYDYIDHDID